MGDEPVVISSGMVHTPESVATKSFGTGFRGYDQGEVRAYLKRVAAELTSALERENDLRESLREATERAANPHLDEETLTAALGEHAARLLTNAREAAESTVSEAEKRAARVVGEAEARIARVRSEADGLLARRSEEADRMTSGLRQAAETAARNLRDRARAEAEAEVESARAQGREMVGEARAVRERMLADLTRRRRTAEVQIDHLRMARLRLLEAYGVVRRTLDEATRELERADTEAGPVLDAAAARPPGARPPDGQNDGQPTRRGPPPDRHTEAVGDGGDQMQRRPAVAAPFAQELAGPLLRGLARVGAAADRPPPAVGDDAKTDNHTAGDDAKTGDDTAGGDTSTAHTTLPPGGPAAPLSADELFARIRAAQSAPPPPAEDGPPPASPVTEATPQPGAASARSSVRAANGTAADIAEPLSASVREESALAWRDRFLEPIQADLVRHLKRVLQDEQNEVLDRLRRQRDVTADGIMAPLDDHVERYQSAATPVLRQAAEVGAGFVSSSGHDAPGYAEAGRPQPRRQWAAEQWAADLAVDLVLPLRERLERVIEGATTSGSGEAARSVSIADASGVAERLGASYRQWKVTEIEQVARHHASAAFSRGVYAATPDDAQRCWVVDDDGPCPDCDDNALAGAVPKGQPFPTGQTHPPAHRGCRCILVQPPP